MKENKQKESVLWSAQIKEILHAWLGPTTLAWTWQPKIAVNERNVHSRPKIKVDCDKAGRFKSSARDCAKRPQENLEWKHRDETTKSQYIEPKRHDDRKSRHGGQVMQEYFGTGGRTNRRVKRTFYQTSRYALWRGRKLSLARFFDNGRREGHGT